MSWQEHDTAHSHFVASSDEPELRLHLRAHGDEPARKPVLFVHGATYASRLYDIPYPGASWLKATADAGLAAYALDVRGYGKSHTAALCGQAPYARATDAIRDIADAVDWITWRHGASSLALVGGSWGTITTALFTATIGRGRVDRLLLYAPIYAERNEGWLRFLADPNGGGGLNPTFRASRPVTEEDTRARWDAEFPEGADWREEPVFQALVQSSLSDDPASRDRTPPAFRAPNGTLLDLWEAFNARPVYTPEAIACPTLLIRGGADRTSTRSDALALLDKLSSKSKQYVEIANGAHFVSAERRAAQVFAQASGFLTAQTLV